MKSLMIQDFAYGEVVNEQLLALMGALSGNVLDVGCGAGRWAPVLRRAGADRLVGIEPSAAAAALAAETYDQVTSCAVEDLELADLGNEPFDWIILADVLEHLVDPWATLRRLREWSSSGGSLVLSVPNLRYYRVLTNLLLRGRFTYARSGVMDWTHLRWFTQSDLRRSLELTGWKPVCWSLPTPGKRGRLSSWTGGRSDPVLAAQLQVVARSAATD